jgi:hypothetical protein
MATPRAASVWQSTTSVTPSSRSPASTVSRRTPGPCAALRLRVPSIPFKLSSSPHKYRSEYHRDCIGPWLTRRRRVCPLCKRDPFQREPTAATSLLAGSNAEGGTYATFDEESRAAEEGAVAGEENAPTAAPGASAASCARADMPSASESDPEAVPLLADSEDEQDQ